MTRTTHHAAAMALFAITTSLITVRARAQTAPIPPNPFIESASRNDEPTVARTTTTERSSNDNAPADAPAPSRAGEDHPDDAVARANEHDGELVPIADSSDAASASERPIEELAARAADADPPPPAPDAAMGALDDVLAGGRDPIAGVDDEPMAPEPQGIPSRAETAAAIAGVTPSVRACARAQTGEIVELRIVFTASGSVTTATVESTHLTPEQRSCIARAARRAHVAAFARPRFEVTYPVRL